MAIIVTFRISVTFWENGNPITFHSAKIEETLDNYMKIVEKTKEGRPETMYFKENVIGEFIVINSELLKRSVISFWEYSREKK